MVRNESTENADTEHLDSTVPLLMDPYRFISRHSKGLGSSVFQTRLMLEPTIAPCSAEEQAAGQEARNGFVGLRHGRLLDCSAGSIAAPDQIRRPQPMSCSRRAAGYLALDRNFAPRFGFKL